MTPAADAVVPRGSVPCQTSSTGWCLSDAENGELIVGQAKAKMEDDRKLCWLRVWFGYPPCPVPKQDPAQP